MIAIRPAAIADVPAMSRVMIASITDLASADHRNDPALVARWTANKTEDGVRKIMIASLRYLDVFAKVDGRWYFVQRDLILDWSETRVLGGE